MSNVFNVPQNSKKKRNKGDVYLFQVRIMMYIREAVVICPNVSD